MIELLNEDCMAVMARYPDKYFDLAVVDPPYGLGIDGQKLNNTNKNPKHNRKEHAKKSWDNYTPDESYFKELMRVSKNQIIWGGNYFTEYLYPVKGWIFWYKGQNDLTMSDGEMAWTSLPIVTKQVEINRSQLISQNTFHPTEKPYKLYKWIYRKLCTPDMKILDTHLGSGSNAVAAFDFDISEFVGCEIDPDYFQLSVKRYKEISSQHKLF